MKVERNPSRTGIGFLFLSFVLAKFLRYNMSKRELTKENKDYRPRSIAQNIVYNDFFLNSILCFGKKKFIILWNCRVK